jgi:uncharacterized membrane protein YbaN (DUF454 family)
MQKLWFCLGWLMVLLGFIGALLPVMPTTIFLILAVGCFARSSPRFEHWLLHHPRYGQTLRMWREQGAISRKGKTYAALGMTLGYLIFVFCAHPSWPLAAGVGVFMAASAAYVGRAMTATTADPATLDTLQAAILALQSFYTYHQP